MDEKVIREYCRQVGKHLKCFRKTKAALLAGLREELLLSEDGKLPPPKETAAVLQESISEAELAKYQKTRKLWTTAIVAIAAIIILCIVFIALWPILPVYQYTAPPVEG